MFDTHACLEKTVKNAFNVGRCQEQQKKKERYPVEYENQNGVPPVTLGQPSPNAHSRPLARVDEFAEWHQHNVVPQGFPRCREAPTRVGQDYITLQEQPPEEDEVFLAVSSIRESCNRCKRGNKREHL